MNRLYYLLILFICGLIGQTSAQTDTDKDGMPDEWEMTHNLNPFLAEDAWLDQDGDFVLNLFEYFLQSNPGDASTPQTIQVTPGEDLEKVLENAPDGVIVRIQEGSYPVNFTHTNSGGDLRLMVQGGWNQDFSQYDPCTYTTQLVDTNGFEWLNVIANDVNAYLMVEGLQMQHSTGISSGLSISMKNGQGAFVVNNCEITNSVFDGFSGAIDLFIQANATIDCWIVNTLVANNVATGIEIDASDSSVVNAHLYHNTVFNNKNEGSIISGGGLDASASGTGILDLEVINSIFFDNEESDVYLLGGSGGTVNLDISHSIVGVTESISNVLIMQGDNMSVENPKFIDAAGGNFSLQGDSPAVSKGLDLGLFGTTPDLGYINCTTLTTDVHVPTAIQGKVQLYPNPVQDYFNLALEMKEANPVDIRLFNNLGQQIKTWSEALLPTGKHRLAFDLPDINSGTYHLQIEVDGQSLFHKLVVH
ncbi:MAG: T9SS type A sorting domain-containing protein [Saprospiraceae bacterium]|nr:T9SS type A sorting domain-containing protein [Saprospiraceae bacterium]